ncbi:MAG: ABC transporter permease subunit [Clostridia bacterium]|nr:ABC transporter permease subunit [Clostridia bacterium]
MSNTNNAFAAQPLDGNSLSRKQKFKITSKTKTQLLRGGMMLPSFVLALIFNIVPLFGLIIAFQKYEVGAGIWKSQFVDVYNFTRLFNRPDFGRVLFNTVYIAIWKIALTTVLSIITALLLNEMVTNRGKKIVQTIIFLPYFLSWALIGAVFVDMFGIDGAVNALLGTKIDFLASNTYFRPIIILTDVWKNIGYQAVVFLAAVTTIDPSLYEAAEVDGANRWQKCWHITLPCIKSMIILICVLNIGNIMNAGFEQILVMYNPIVYETGDILDTLSYREAMVTGSDYSLSTAIGLFRGVINCILFAIAYKIAHKVNGYKIF